MENSFTVSTLERTVIYECPHGHRTTAPLEFNASCSTVARVVEERKSGPLCAVCLIDFLMVEFPMHAVSAGLVEEVFEDHEDLK